MSFTRSGEVETKRFSFALFSSQKILSASSIEGAPRTWHLFGGNSIFFPLAIKQRFHRYAKDCRYPTESGEFAFGIPHELYLLFL